MSDGQTDGAVWAAQVKRSEEFLSLFARLLVEKKRDEDTFSSDLFSNDNFRQDWERMLGKDYDSQKFYALLCEGDETAWGILLGGNSQDSRWWQELKEMSPFKDCVVITGGYFVGGFGSERFRIIPRSDFERYLETQVKDNKVPGSLGEKYVFFIPVEDGKGTTVHFGHQRPKASR